MKNGICVRVTEYNGFGKKKEICLLVKVKHCNNLFQNETTKHSFLSDFEDTG